MPLLSTREAIGAVSEALRSQLQSRSLILTTVKRPEVAAVDDVVPKLNLFLYQIDFIFVIQHYSQNNLLSNFVNFKWYLAC